MLYVDIPTRADIQRLGAVRAAACVSIYLPTTPLTQDAQADRIALKNLAGSAIEQLRTLGTHKAEVAAIEEALADLVDDDEFWRFQARSLAVLATAAETLTFRLPNTLQAASLAGDRFFIKPLLRALTVSQSAYVLALAQGAVRLVEVSGDLPSVTVKVEGLPSDVASAVGKASIQDRSQAGRIQGTEGQKVRMRQYARLVDQALRGLLAGSETPLILAAAQPLDAIFRSVCSYPHLVAESIEGNPEKTPDEDLGRASRALLDRLHQARTGGPALAVRSPRRTRAHHHRHRTGGQGGHLRRRGHAAGRHRRRGARQHRRRRSRQLRCGRPEQPRRGRPDRDARTGVGRARAGLAPGRHPGRW